MNESLDNLDKIVNRIINIVHQAIEDESETVAKEADEEVYDIVKDATKLELLEKKKEAL